jgi:hypothetical protein
VGEELTLSPLAGEARVNEPGGVQVVAAGPVVKVKHCESVEGQVLPFFLAAMRHS